MKYKYRFFLFLTLIGFCGYLLFAVYNDVKKETIKQLNDRQLSHAKQAAKGIESFFNNHLSMLTYLSKTDSIIDLDDRGKALIRLFYSNNSAEINGITRVDAKGRITYTFPYDHKSIGADISSQDHVQEIMRTHKPVVSDVFTAVQGFRCVAFHVPVFKGKDYDGTIAILIPFDHISRKYLEDIKIGENGYAWLISRKGVELYCPVPGHIGKTVYETSGNFPSVISMAEEMMKGKQGITTYRYDRIRDAVTDIEEKHAVYLPIPILNTYWSIVVATPEDEVLALMKSFRNSWFLIIGVLILASILLSYYLIKAWTIVSEEEKRKRAEEALRKSEEKYRAIIENMQEGYHEVDIKGNFTFFNESMCKIIGYEREELLGMNNRQYADEENTRKVYQVYNGVYRTGKPVKNFEWQIIRKDGDRRDIDVSISLIRDAEGHPTGFRGIVRDTTDRKRAEEEKRSLQERLQRAEKMEALGILAGGVAHDLNNVLGIVIGYAELLLMDADKSSSIRPILVNIVNGGQRAAAIVQDLLTLARRGVSGREVLNLNKIIADCQQSPEFKNLSSYHSAVRIKADLEPDLLNISGSSVHLGKTLFNLVSNASEAMPRGGVLTIKTANQYLDRPIQGYDEVREGDYVVLSVSDTGEGIQAADLKRIFEPFYTKKVMGRSGTGLGLAVVWGTVKDHNGYINVQSEEGKGSIFTLYFPVTREGISAEAVAMSISEYMGKGESILIVDDVKEQGYLATGMLQKLNYSVESASSGEEAVAYLKEHNVDLMVLDMIMDPGMDGLDTYRKVLEIHPKQKAIIVSGFSETDRVITAQALGAGAYIRKPYIIEKLGLAVRTELDRST